MGRRSEIIALEECRSFRIRPLGVIFKANTNDSAIDLMKYLVAKYPDGYEGWAKENGEEPIIR
jgi:hypothetical protein